MDLSQMLYFQTVAEIGHMNNAANVLNIAQPALSLSISRLESTIGAPISDRVARELYLNRCGDLYLEIVNNHL